MTQEKRRIGKVPVDCVDLKAAGLHNGRDCCTVWGCDLRTVNRVVAPGLVVSASVCCRAILPLDDAGWQNLANLHCQRREREEGRGHGLSRGVPRLPRKA
jgi:hypothetical protein